MPSPCCRPWAWGPAGPGRAAAADPHLRVSDADRAEAAERLSKHYGEGRLDQAEFDARLEKAMSAKTRGDLSGLLDDLPAGDPPPQAPPGLPRRPVRTVAFLIIVLVLAAAAGRVVFHPFLLFPFFLPVPWLVIGLLAFVLLRRRRSWRRPR